MIQTIEIFYSFQCPYSYLAIDKLSQIENNYDVKVLWQPYSAQAAGQNQNQHLFPEKASYIREDVVRIAKAMELPLVMKSTWPEESFDSEKSTRGAVVASDLDLIFDYNIKMFHRWWGEGGEPNEQEFFVELCDDLDVDPNEFAGRISTTDTRERVRGVYKRGRKLGVYETPTIIIGEERFIGIDRIQAAEDRLIELGLRKS